MSDPVQRIARYAEMRRLKPIGNLAASIHCIHPGTEWEAELTLADIEDIVARITQLEADRAELTADRDAILAAYRHLKKVGDRLSVCAQTTGGVAGPDSGLQDAIEDWAKCRRLLSDLRMAAAEPNCSISAGAAALEAHAYLSRIGDEA